MKKLLVLHCVSTSPHRLLPLNARIDLINDVVRTINGPIGARLLHDLHHNQDGPKEASSF